MISVNVHHSTTVAVSSHHDCAGNLVSKEEHIEQIKKCVEVVKSWGLQVRITGLLVKENAPELLKKELENKPREIIYIDSYQPAEAKYRYVRRMFEICLEFGFPVFINEKSPLLLQDLDILKKINEKSYLNVCWSIIIAKDDEVRLAFEPKAPLVKSRFAAMKKLAENKILTGTAFMPILPFIYDNEKNIEEIYKKQGIDGLMQIKGIGKSTAASQIEEFLKNRCR